MSRRALLLVLFLAAAAVAATSGVEGPRAEKTAGNPLLMARTRAQEAEAFDREGDLARAEAAWRQAIALRERQASAAAAPGRPALALAEDLDGLGWVLVRRGDLAGAEAAFQRAFALRRQLAPDSLALAASLNKLGIVATERGDLAGGEALFQRSLAIRERLAPDSLLVASTGENLALLATYRGDLARAEALYRRAAALKQRLAPGSEHVARALLNQGLARWKRGDLAGAEDLLTEALALWQKLAPDGYDTAGTLTNLGLVALDRGEMDLAEERFGRAVEIWQELSPGGRPVAAALVNLGIVKLQRREWEEAADLLRRSLALYEAAAPESLDVAVSLHNLGDLARLRGRLRQAEPLLLRAVALRSRLAPGSVPEAESWYSLGLLYRRSGRPAQARRALERAVAAVEAQEGKLGGPEEVRSSFGRLFADVYRDLIDHLLEQGQAEEAFLVSERYRARRLLSLLAERDLLWSADLSADLVRERSRLAVEYDRAQAALARLDGRADPADVEALHKRLRELGDRRAYVAESVRLASPRLASLEEPRPRDATGARAALDPGTVLLSYVVENDRTRLFVLPHLPGEKSLRVLTLPLGEAALREQVEAFRHLVQRPQAGPKSLAALAARGRGLSNMLLGPAVPWIAGGDRVLLLPDGPLHALPFAALPVPAAGGPAGARYVVEWKPLHVAASATVYAELRKRRKRPPGSSLRTELVAFGDPLSPPAVAGRRLPPLPAARLEMEELAKAFPGARIFLGEQATEEALERVGSSARYLHLAGHAVVDEHSPLDSYLALAAPRRPRHGRDNGLLQAWEIFEQVRLDADLVTLSACETGLGRELAGEGVLGLARAFQYAGARSVVASLWSLSDRSTAVLMQRFYGGLRRGLGKDEALRRAQLTVLRQDETAHPFYWAAHQLIGDWH